MKTKLFTMIAAVGALATLATGCDKPDETPSCLIGRGLWIAKYQKVDETPTGGADCVQREGDVLNINKYQAFPEQGQPAPLASIAIKPYVYRYSRMFTADKPTATTTVDQRVDLSFGPFASNLASNNLCSVPDMSLATITAKGGSPVQADVDTDGIVTSYKWTNVQFLDDRTHPGQQMQADLEYVHGTCTQHYKVTALYELNALTGAVQACTEQADCDPHADPNDTTRLININGSGINPDYPVYCDVNLGVYTGVGPLFLGTPLSFPVGVCFLDGPFGTTCDSSSNPNCWKSGPQGSVAP